MDRGFKCKCKFKGMLIIIFKINNHLFQVNSFFTKNGNKVAEGKIIHCSLDVDSRNKIGLPDQLERWIEASNVSTNLKEC